MKPSSSPFSPFKSKKIIQSSTKTASSDEIFATDPNTPEKPMQLQRRSRNRGVAFSVKDVRKIAEGLRKSEKEGPSDRTNLIKTSRQTEKQIGSGSSVNLVVESSKKAAGSIKLPEKYEILGEFFDCMECSIRLLRLKGTMSTFTNICPKIESLTDRRFSYTHLAQLKYILPEAIVLKKVLLHDERTLCMKPDLQVTLQADVFENNGKRKAQSVYSNMRKVFHDRLLNFFKAHPEGDEIPEETLPEPFNQTKQKILSNMKEACIPSLPVESSANALPNQYSAVASHMSRSFQRRFVDKVPITESEKTQLLSTTLKPSTTVVQDPCFKETCLNERTLNSIVPSFKCVFSKPHTIRQASMLCSTPLKLPRVSHLETCNEETKHMENEDCSPIEIDGVQGTPAKQISTPVGLMTITPDLQTPKRCRISQDDDSTASPNKLVRRLPRNRSLFHTPKKNAKAEDEIHEMGGSSVDADIIKLLSPALIQSIREKEKKAMEDNDSGVSQAKRRQQMIACLPKLFNMIHLIFQSIKRCVITKEELMHKIIASNCDIVDRGEVEEQLKLLQELVPDWIWEKVASSGDYLFCMNKMSCPESIRRRLAEAV